MGRLCSMCVFLAKVVMVDRAGGSAGPDRSQRSICRASRDELDRSLAESRLEGLWPSILATNCVPPGLTALEPLSTAKQIRNRQESGPVIAGRCMNLEIDYTDLVSSTEEPRKM